MKTNPFFTFFKKMLFVLPFVYLSSCQKEVSQITNLEDAGKLQAITKVNAWLEGEKSATNEVRNTVIASVKNNLSFSDIRLEKLSETESLIIVPIKDGFKSAVNKDKNPANHLLLIVNEAGNIRKGNIVQFIPKAATVSRVLPINTFYNFYNADHLVSDGSFTFLNMNDKILYQMDYKDGELSAYSEKQNKGDNNTANNTVSSTASNCTNWYWVITYPDGSQDWQYLYTTCGQDQTLEPDGGGDWSEAEIVMSPVQKQWVVAANANGYWYVHSTEQLNGTKKGSLPGGGYFTNITHLSENVVDVANTSYIWTRSGVTVSYSGSSAQSTVSGILKTPTNVFPDKNIPPTTHIFNFSQVYP